jgi:hypothetical protein
MIYLVIILILLQVINFIFHQRILFSVKRRYKQIDGRIRNLSQWIITNDQTISHRLQQIHDLVYSQHSKMQNLNTRLAEPAEACESTSLSMHMQVLHKQKLEKITAEDIQQYYAFLLHELQQLSNSISKARQQES